MSRRGQDAGRGIKQRQRGRQVCRRVQDAGWGSRSISSTTKCSRVGGSVLRAARPGGPHKSQRAAWCGRENAGTYLMGRECLCSRPVGRLWAARPQCLWAPQLQGMWQQRG